MESGRGPWGDGVRDEPQLDRTARTVPATDRLVSLAPPRSKESRPARGFVARWTRRLLLIALLLLIGLIGQIIVYRYAMPSWTPTMAASYLLGEPVDQRWVPLRRISPQLIRAVIASEDAKFCTHHGIDFGELKAAIEDAKGGSSPRGASTITMQVVKNVLLWPGRSYVRKALELPLALMVEVAWSKRRILEVYLNIAEWGPGIYGIEAAARQAFGRSAAGLTAGEAARLVVVLPNPIERDPRDLEPHTERVAEIVESRARSGVNTRCLD